MCSEKGKIKEKSLLGKYFCKSEKENPPVPTTIYFFSSLRPNLGQATSYSVQRAATPGVFVFFSD